MKGLARGWQGSCGGVLLVACGTSNTYYEEHIHIERRAPDAGASAVANAGAGDREEEAEVPQSPPSAGGDGGRSSIGEPAGLTPLAGGLGADAGVALLSPGAPSADVAPAELALDVFGTLGNRYWFEASEGQVELMNAPYLANGGVFYGDIYTPHGGLAEVSFVDHLFVTSAGEPAHTADFGKVQVRLVGQSTGRPWTRDSLPNFKIDADEFVDGNRIGGVKHMRLNNAVVGSIFREKLTYDLFNALGYPAPRTNYAWVSGSVWGPEIDVPYIAVESYKPQFCKLREAELGGGCVNMWEFYGDLGTGILGFAESCQFSECDPTRGLEFEDVVASAPYGEGYRAALEDWLDWDAFHRFQCLSWILETGDDAIHNLNNFVLVERADGKFMHLPYSVDISLGQEWYSSVSLAGYNAIATGCQSDPVCWAETIAACEELVGAFAELDPIGMLDANYAQLQAAGMLRSGDEDRYESLRRHIEQRLEALPGELEQNRELPQVPVYCDYPFIQCGNACVFPEECVLCEPPPFEEGEAAAGEPAGDGAPDAGAGEPAEPGSGQVPPPEPDACLPPIDYYGGILF